MKTHWFTRFHLLALTAVLALGLTACDTLNETETAQLSDEEVAVLTSVVADGLALETDGLMAGVYDLTADVTRDSLRHRHGPRHGGPGHGPGGPHHDGPWRGDRNFEAVYDSTTGEHTISFERSVDRPRMQKSLSAELGYVFQDADGAFLQFPRRDSEAVATISFEGVRAGSTYAERDRGRRQGTHASSFEHTSNWLLSGADTDVMTLAGSQARNGTRTMVSERHGTVERTFSMSMSLIDVTLAVPASDEEGLEDAISGTIEYVVTVTRTRDGETETKEHEGTIELTEDGHALMRVMGLRQAFRIGLYDGEVEDQ